MVGTAKAAKAETPDAHFTATQILYGVAPRVLQNLGKNEKVAPGGQVGKDSALYQFLNSNGAGDAATLRAGEGVPHNGSSGLGFTTDAIVRVVGNVYFQGGNYDFKVHSDDGFRLRIDGKDIIDFDKNRSPSDTISLEKHPQGIEISEGVHEVELVYWEQGSQGVLDFKYKLNGDTAYKTLDLTNVLMLRPEETLDLNELQDIQQNNGKWEIRTGDILDGEEGRDNITGSDGRDFIFGDEGNDILAGGAGKDTFIFGTKMHNGHDVIKDFTIGEESPDVGH